MAETFQTRFYPPDGQSDWASAFIKRAKLVSVVLADPTSSGQTDVQNLARTLAAHM